MTRRLQGAVLLLLALGISSTRAHGQEPESTPPIAFWKTFLEGDHRYMRHLTPGYANVHGFPTLVTIAE